MNCFLSRASQISPPRGFPASRKPKTEDLQPHGSADPGGAAAVALHPATRIPGPLGRVNGSRRWDVGVTSYPATSKATRLFSVGIFWGKLG